jgi:23S rRNA (adenine1618-N6)-methyltransferase
MRQRKEKTPIFCESFTSHSLGWQGFNALLQACTGASVEMVTAGGEVSFVERMIKESLALRERVEWYTTMLGKFSSVSAIVDRLKEVGVQNWAITEFVQGTKTRRWAVGWSWGDMHPRMVKAT